MPTFARIDKNVVAEIITVNDRIENLFHSELKWIEVPPKATVGSGWTWNGSTFEPPHPEPPPLVQPTLRSLQKEISSLQERIAAISHPGPENKDTR